MYKLLHIHDLFDLLNVRDLPTEKWMTHIRANSRIGQKHLPLPNEREEMQTSSGKAPGLKTDPVYTLLNALQTEVTYLLAGALSFGIN